MVVTGAERTLPIVVDVHLRIGPRLFPLQEKSQHPGWRAIRPIKSIYISFIDAKILKYDTQITSSRALYWFGITINYA